MTYAIKFVNFTLAAPFQKDLGRWRGVRALHALYGIPTPMMPVGILTQVDRKYVVGLTEGAH